jgi:hypothetical protein
MASTDVSSPAESPEAGTVDMNLEVVTLPVPTSTGLRASTRAWDGGLTPISSVAAPSAWSS